MARALSLACCVAPSTAARLFHIDFGYILGNDPKPFPLAMKICKVWGVEGGGRGERGKVATRIGTRFGAVPMPLNTLALRERAALCKPAEPAINASSSAALCQLSSDHHLNTLPCLLA